jgi:hypothetical protein
MNDHADCMKEAAFLRQSLEDARASALNFQKQLATKAAGMNFALSSGEKCARLADDKIKKLNEIIDQTHAEIYKLLEAQGKSHSEISDFMQDLPGYNRPGLIGER